MTDLQYVYQSDIREKKSTGRGIFHKKNGSKSKKCTLPSDYMTRKEKMAMSGECKTYDMRKFYTYEEFKQFPDDIQLQYLNSLINRYDVTIAAIADELFHITPTGLYKYLRKHELLQYINKAPNGKSAMALQGRARLMSAIEKANSPEEEIIEQPVEEITPESNNKVAETELIVEEKKSPSSIQHMSIALNSFDDDIWSFFKECFKNQKVDIRMSIQVKES